MTTTEEGLVIVFVVWVMAAVPMGVYWALWSLWGV